MVGCVIWTYWARWLAGFDLVVWLDRKADHQTLGMLRLRALEQGPGWGAAGGRGRAGDGPGHGVPLARYREAGPDAPQALLVPSRREPAGEQLYGLYTLIVSTDRRPHLAHITT
jgi:hypothetical protein